MSPDRSRLIAVSDANEMIAVHNGKHAKAYVVGDKLPDLSIDLLELPSGKLVKQLAKNAPETIFPDRKPNRAPPHRRVSVPRNLRPREPRKPGPSVDKAG
jgi:hypothetical protein